MSNEQKITDEQTNPADLNKAIPEIAPTLPETDEISPKLASADAIVNEFLEECRAVIEKKAKNTEKNGDIREQKGTNGNIREEKVINGDIREQMGIKGNTMGQKGKKSTNTNIPNSVQYWYFDGEVIRTILRFSLLKNIEIYNHFKISKNKFNSLLRGDIVPPEVTKHIAQRLELNTPEELQEYYDMIPKEVKEAVNWDARIYRPLKPGIVIPAEIFNAAEKIGKLAEVIEAARVSQGR